MGALHRLQERVREALGEPGEVPSPCVSICRMDEAVEYCVGCWRTLDEIAAWARMTEDEKRDIWRQLPGRAQKGQP